MTRMKFKDTIALIYARRKELSAGTSWRTTVLFLALLIPFAGKLAAAEDQPGADSTLVIDVYSGAVAPDATQEKEFWLWLETLKKTEEPDEAGGVPRVIHIEHPLSDKDFDLNEQADANGQKVVVQGHVSRKADGKFTVAFSELGRPPAYTGKTELTLGPAERRVLRLPILTQPDGQDNLETVVVIWTPGVTKDQSGHSRFEVH